jgi:hypothetical protein
MDTTDRLDQAWLRRHHRRERDRVATPAEVRTWMRIDQAPQPALVTDDQPVPSECRTHVIQSPSGAVRARLAWFRMGGTLTPEMAFGPLLVALRQASDDEAFEAILAGAGPRHERRYTRQDEVFQACEEASVADRAWFAEHPGARWRTRRPLPGEDPSGRANGMLVITSPGRGHRVRMGFAGPPFDPPFGPEVSALLQAANDRQFIRLGMGLEPPDELFDAGGNLRSEEPGR